MVLKASTTEFRILIPVFNPPIGLFRTLFSLRDDQQLARVIIIDDGSTNGFATRIASEFPEVSVIKGDGSLWWCGAMRLGMEYALKQNADVVVWLNHDCIPALGTIDRLVCVASKDGHGAVSAWCRSAEAPDFPVNPGFRNFKEISVDELNNSETVTVDGLNGNCVAISSAAIRAVGLPDADKHPHYGDGPYTYRLHKAGFRNTVCTSALAFLEREYDRCVSITWRCAFWNVPLTTKLSYYFLSKKSKFHWSIKYHDVVAFRGFPLAPIAYLGAMARAFGEIVVGHKRRKTMSRDRRLELVCREYEGKFPQDGMIRSLTHLENDEV